MELTDWYEKVLEARERIHGYVRETPLEYSVDLSQLGDCKVYIKLENEQVTGSFKVRGAFNKCSKLADEDPDIKDKGAVTASSGNHALACVRASKAFGIPMTVVVPTIVSKAKDAVLTKQSANLIYHGTDCVETELKARETAKEKSAFYIPPYNDVDVVAGQGTISLEILEQLPDVDVVLVPVGGGGLIGGIAVTLKQAKPSVQVIGCQPELSKVMYESVKAGKIIFEESGDTLSDGTAGGVEENSVTFPLCQKYVDDWILVSEDEIAKAVFFMLEQHHKIVEGAAGTGVGAFMKNPKRFQGKNVAIISCGGNISMTKLKGIMDNYYKD